MLCLYMPETGMLPPSPHSNYYNAFNSFVMKRYFPALCFIALSAIVTSCSKDNIEPAPVAIPHQKIADGFAIGAGVKVELYARKALSTGYNTVYFALYDSISKAPIEKAQLSMLPMMDMGTMKHSAPAEQPGTAAKDRLFTGALVFTMPSGEMGSWTVEVNITNGTKQGKLILPVTIANAPAARLKSFVSKVDNAKFIVAYIEPSAPKVGVNDMEIAIFRSKSMMEFPADSSLSVALTPEMPTMGHGSPNNVDPVHITKGHYKGKVNFTMTGLWYLNLDFKAGAAISNDNTFFEVNF